MYITIITIFFIIYIILSIRKEENEWQSNLMVAYRGILALVIILDHISQEMNNPGLMKMFSYFGYITVSCFFALSGYGLTEQYKKNGNEYFRSFFKKRLPKILLPFWTSNIVYLVVNIFVYNQDYSCIDLSMYLFGIKLINTNSWYVVSLLIMYLIYYVSLRIIAKGDVKKSLIFVLLGISIYGVICLLYIKTILVDECLLCISYWNYHKHVQKQCT